MRNIYQGKLSFLIIEALEKSVDGCVRFEDFANNTWMYARGYDRPLKKSSLSVALDRLKKKGLISQEITDKSLIFKLTDSGRDIFSNPLSEKNWDGIWRVVIWDIPEQKRVIRNLLRRNLKKWGFKPLQKSVWISKQPVYEKLSSYIKDLKIEEWVQIFEANRSTFSPLIIY